MNTFRYPKQDFFAVVLVWGSESMNEGWCHRVKRAFAGVLRCCWDEKSRFYYTCTIYSVCVAQKKRLKYCIMPRLWWSDRCTHTYSTEYFQPSWEIAMRLQSQLNRYKDIHVGKLCRQLTRKRQGSLIMGWCWCQFVNHQHINWFLDQCEVIWSRGSMHNTWWKRSGPSKEPWCTPWLIRAVGEQELPMLTKCFIRNN